MMMARAKHSLTGAIWLAPPAVVLHAALMAVLLTPD